MRIAIMQPYLFPYLGYFQLIKQTDSFICLDDVMFIKQGWIHRNKLLFNGSPTYFTVPLHKASQNIAILDIEICLTNIGRWRKKFFASLKNFYKKTPYYSVGIEMTNYAFSHDTKSIAEIARRSIDVCCSILDITTHIEPTSTIYNKDLMGEDRIISICKSANATKYINLSGGMEIYSREKFMTHGIDLHFIQPNTCLDSSNLTNPYPTLSILDTIMRHGPEMTKKMLAQTYLLL